MDLDWCISPPCQAHSSITTAAEEPDTPSPFWRGKQLQSVGEREIEWLVNESFRDMSPNQMAYLSEEIRADLINNHDLHDIYGLGEADLEVLDEAARWLEFWASKGYPLVASC